MGHFIPAATADATENVGAIARDNFVALPGWFSVRQARAILRLKRKRYAVLLGRSGIVHAATDAALGEAVADKLLVACATRLGPPLTPDVPLDEALFRMDRHDSVFVPLVVDGVLVGIVARDEVAKALASTPSSGELSMGRLAA
jgi:hypothetical protein